MLKSIEDAYSEVVHWQKNTFNVPFGKAGKGFVLELSRLLRAYADGSALESIAEGQYCFALTETFPPFKTEGSFSLPGETPAQLEERRHRRIDVGGTFSSV